ncbi:hypothetical protein [Cellulomonas cellasea]|uniref:Uncharacterized protein n=1 Tax=Cellulomonas cellasea TaxID=43670 RepID=A0A4Y3L219_9CELL|nr:hypothetical protein [Cellulomonas cellasea]GEA90227.1 hypothetical protein CCE01nite_41760 [Cellulomonas cellasea]
MLRRHGPLLLLALLGGAVIAAVAYWGLGWEADRSLVRGVVMVPVLLLVSRFSGRRRAARTGDAPPRP